MEARLGLPIGFRFRPTDEELLLHYLRRKALACPLPADVIPVADLARLHPWDLVPVGAGGADGERFFFYRPETRCWRRGGGGSRAAGTGVWKPSGKEKLVVSPRCKRAVGSKRTLVFYHRRGGGSVRARTEWVMHEYRLLPAGLQILPPPLQVGGGHGAAAAAEVRDWVVCRIFKREKPAQANPGRDDDAAESSSSSSESSCVTDSSGAGDQEEDDEQSSGASNREE